MSVHHTTIAQGRGWSSPTSGAGRGSAAAVLNGPSSPPYNANSAGVCKPLRQSFRVIQAPSNQGKGFDPKGFRVVLVAVFDRPANYRQCTNEFSIGGFHVSSSVAAPSLEPIT